MKVPPRRKGNALLGAGFSSRNLKGLNESPSEKEGKWWLGSVGSVRLFRLNESPSEKEGKLPVDGYQP